MNLQHFDRALYERASRRKSRGFDRAFYDRCVEERRAGGHSSSAAAIAGSKSGVAVVPPTTIFGANLYMWWTAETGITNSAGVCSAITDQSGNAHNGTLFGAGPAIVTSDASLSGRQTLTVASGKSFYANPVALNGTFTLMTVVNFTTWTNTNNVWGDISVKGISTTLTSPNIAMNNGSYVNPSPATLGGTTWALIIQEYTNSTNDRQKVGAGAWTTTPGSNAGNTGLTSLGFNLAASPGAGGFQFFQGMAVTGTPSAGQYTQLRTWLGSLSASITF